MSAWQDMTLTIPTRLVGVLRSTALVVGVIVVRCDPAAPHVEARTQLSASSSPLEDVEERDRSFALSGQTFTAVRHHKRLPGKKGPDAQALASLEILDAAGAVLHREAFPYSVDRAEFSESCSADLQSLDGSNGKGFLIESQCLPAAPLSGGPWEILGLLNGKLVHVGKPLMAEGEMGEFLPGAINRVGGLSQILPDTLSVRVWTGYFFATVRVRINWLERTLALADHCFYQTGHGFAEEGCETPIQGIERAPADQDLTFVRLFSEPREPSGTPAHVVIRRDSNVELLLGKVVVTWDEGPDAVNLGVGGDLWLKVRIDGKEGWIHTDEDFTAIGLRVSG